MSKPSFLAELKRRNVLRASALYIGSAWALAQGLAQLFPAFGVPDWVVRWIVIAAVVGFPFFAAFAWFYEITPDGLRRESEIAPDDSIAHHTGKKLDRWIIAVLALSVVLLLTDRLVLRPSSHADNTAATATPAASTKPVTDKSIAVLPFENLSEDKANGYFADGIQDQILTGLAQIGDLKVISRTSTQRYASRPDNLSQIAKELGVAHILEGSVQKAGNRVRINVQLIQADTDSHLWAQTYDRTLDDIFAVESEVAQKIAEALQARLTRAERTALSTRPTDNPAAYEAYLKARTLLLGSPYDRDNNDRIVAALQATVQLDPDFTAAWAELASKQLFIYWGGFDASSARLAAARAALDRAVALDPDAPQVQIVRAQYLYTSERDFLGSVNILNGLKSRVPNDARLWFRAALAERRLGRFDAAVADFAQARSLDPNDARTIGEYGLTLFHLRRFAEADRVIDAGLALQPDDPSLLTIKLFNAWDLAGIQGGARVLASVQSDAPLILALRARQALLARDYATASVLLRRALAGKEDTRNPLDLAGYLPGDVGWRLLLAFCEQRNGAPDAAAGLYRQVQARAQAALTEKQDNPNIAAAWHAALGWAQAGLGLREASIANARRGTELIPEASDAMEGPTWSYYLAQTYALNGDAGHALAIIEHLLQIPSGVTATSLRLDPFWDTIRDDPRFQALIGQDRAMVDSDG